MAFQFFSQNIGPFWVPYISCPDMPIDCHGTQQNLESNEDSEIWQKAKRHMVVVGRSVTSFLDGRYTDEGTEIAQKELTEATKERIDAMTASVAKKKTFRQPKKPQKATIRIQYEEKVEHVKKISEYLSQPGMSASDVGRHTFQFFLRNEVGED